MSVQLEAVEERMLNYLATASTALVPLSALFKHCRRQEGFEQLREADLLHFLRKHALVQVIEPTAGLLGELEGMAEIGPLTNAEPRIVLNNRVPSQRELGLLMFEQLDTFTQAIEQALQEPEGARSPEVITRLHTLHARAQDLKDRLAKML